MSLLPVILIHSNNVIRNKHNTHNKTTTTTTTTTNNNNNSNNNKKHIRLKPTGAAPPGRDLRRRAAGHAYASCVALGDT